MINIEKSNKSLPKSFDKKSDFISAKNIFQLINPLRTSYDYFGKIDTSKMSPWINRSLQRVISKKWPIGNGSFRKLSISSIFEAADSSKWLHFEIGRFGIEKNFRNDLFSKWSIFQRTNFTKLSILDVIDFESTNVSKWTIFKVIDFEVTKIPNWPVFQKCPLSF